MKLSKRVSSAVKTFCKVAKCLCISRKRPQACGPKADENAIPVEPVPPSPSPVPLPPLTLGVREQSDNLSESSGDTLVPVHTTDSGKSDDSSSNETRLHFEPTIASSASIDTISTDSTSTLMDYTQFETSASIQLQDHAEDTRKGNPNSEDSAEDTLKGYPSSEDSAEVGEICTEAHSTDVMPSTCRNDNSPSQTATPRKAAKNVTSYKHHMMPPKDLESRVKHQFVCMEHCIQIMPDSVLGFVRILNIARKKKIIIRYTNDGWNTHHDARAMYVYSPDDLSERYMFELPLKEGRVEFDVCYRAKKTKYWINNSGNSYRIPNNNY